MPQNLMSINKLPNKFKERKQNKKFNHQVNLMPKRVPLHSEVSAHTTTNSKTDIAVQIEQK
jgi:hypothetical protein